MRKFILPFIIITCIAILLMQCEKNDDSKEPQWTTYTIADGLEGNRVLAIAIDKEENKWFGTSKGISELLAVGNE